jgi:predicted Rossmann fold nucleotide-binding protein DprA/Smf involved in DNA uptake
MPIRIHQREVMKDLAADGNYYYDAEGNVTTDESKGVRWLAREGANVLPEHREALAAFQKSNPTAPAEKKAEKVAQDDEGADEKKAAKASANKKATPSKNKGAK